MRLQKTENVLLVLSCFTVIEHITIDGVFISKKVILTSGAIIVYTLARAELIVHSVNHSVAHLVTHSVTHSVSWTEQLNSRDSLKAWTILV